MYYQEVFEEVPQSRSWRRIPALTGPAKGTVIYSDAYQNRLKAIAVQKGVHLFERTRLWNSFTKRWEIWAERLHYPTQRFASRYVLKNGERV